MSYNISSQLTARKRSFKFTDIMESTNDDIPKISCITQVSSFFYNPSLDWACMFQLLYQNNLYDMGNQIAKLTVVTTEMICTMVKIRSLK